MKHRTAKVPFFSCPRIQDNFVKILGKNCRVKNRLQISGCITFVFGTMVELAFVCYITRCKASSLPKEPSTPPPSTSLTGLYSSGNSGSRCFKPNSYSNGSCRSDKGSILCHDRASRRSTVNRENSLLLRGGGSPSPPLGIARIRTNPSPPPGNGNGGIYEMGTFISQQPLTFEQINGHQPTIPAYMKPKRRRFSFSIAPESIDKFSIVMFPLAFTIFNVSF